MSDVIFDLTVTHTRFSPVFVVGFPRSGTSLTCRLLRRYLKVSFGTESQFIIRYLKRLGQFGDLNSDENLRRLFYEISTERFFARTRANWGFVFDVEKAIKCLTIRNYPAVLDAIFRQLAEHNQMVRWGDKTPAYNLNLREIHELFPDAQFVHVVRDGRDVTLSIQKQGFGAKNACQAAGDWLRALDAIRGFSATLPTEQFHEFRYEDLTGNPVATLDRLRAFLRIEDGGGRWLEDVGPRVVDEVIAHNSNKWHQALPAREIERFEAIAGHALDHFGYDLAHHGRPRRVSALERRYWNLHGMVQRWSKPAYWADNAYRGARRARELMPQAFRQANATNARGEGRLRPQGDIR